MSEPKKRSTVQLSINTTHWQSGTNRYRLPFAQPLDLRGRNAKLSMYQYGIYNSTYNISSALQNNTFYITWLGATKECVIPDGFYSVSDLNVVLQFNLTKNKYYCINTTNSSQVVFNFALSVNSARYAVQLDINFIPASTSTFWSTYSQPSTPGWTKPSVNTYPTIIFNTNLEKLLGFDTSIVAYPSSTTVGTESSKSFLSVTYPVLSPIFTYIVTCNLINNRLSQIPNLFHQIPLNKAYGQLLNETLGSSEGLTCEDTTFNYLEISFLDQNYNFLQRADPDMTMSVLLTMDV
jgi:hypothetical protein